MTDKPTFVSRDMMTADEGYVQWMADIKQRFRQSQLKAAVRVNTAMLEFYWSMGRDIVEMRAESKWGSDFFNQLSLDLRTAFPNETGFSSANLRYMKRWYQFYHEQVTILQQPAEEIVQQPAEELKMPEIFGQIPWFHHVTIFTKSKTLEEALYYVNKVAEEGWSRSRLEDQISANLFGSQGAAVTNFANTLPATWRIHLPT